ncbi:MAG: beta-galactosidase, partial [Phycisphaerae bacterium]|nr:beta-galactosidase [Phycisphaerae bacterium]
MIRNWNLVTALLFFAAGVVLSVSAVNLQAQPPVVANSPGVVFIDKAETLDHWRANQDVTLTLDKAYRKTGLACLSVKFLIDKTKPGTAMFSRVGIGLTRVPESLQMYLLIPRWQKFTWGEARVRMIVQDADGTAVIAFLSGDYKKDNSVFPKPFYYLWPKIRVKLADREPYWPGANGKLDGIETITFEMPHRVEEFMFDGPFEFRLDEIAAVYPGAMESIEARVKQIAQRQAKLRATLASIRAKGTWRRYPTASLKVIDYFLDWSLAEAKEGKYVRAARNLEYIEALCDRLDTQLAAAVKGDIPWPESPPANCSNLKLRDGNYYDGRRPVYIHGFCGWAGPTEIAGIAEMGFNGISSEVNPHDTMPCPDVRRAPQGLIERIQACRANNMAFDALIQFHSIPDWIRQKYGNLTSSPLRLANNRFLPWDVSDANLRRLVKEQLEVVIPAIKGFDNLISYDLNNEVWYLMLGDFRPDDFRAWLKKKYTGIAALNAAWGTKFGTFDDVQYQASHPTAVDDLYRFNQDRVTDYYRWQVGEARKLDDTRPYYIKIHG